MGLAKVSREGPDGRYVGFAHHPVPVVTTQRLVQRGRGQTMRK